MLHKKAFANSLALLSSLSYLLFTLFYWLAPGLFSFIFNALFFGANITSLFPADFSLGKFIGDSLVLLIGSWLFGFVWAWFYNRFSRQNNE
ncbi:MAG: DUF5676 family membrane protein [Patescibacteria group bacterium]